MCFLTFILFSYKVPIQPHLLIIFRLVYMLFCFFHTFICFQINLHDNVPVSEMLLIPSLCLGVQQATLPSERPPASSEGLLPTSQPKIIRLLLSVQEHLFKSLCIIFLTQTYRINIIFIILLICRVLSSQASSYFYTDIHIYIF